MFIFQYQMLMGGRDAPRLVTASPVMEKCWRPTWGRKYPENGLVKPPRRDTRALSPTGVFGGKAPIRLAAQKRINPFKLQQLRDSGSEADFYPPQRVKNL
jgi:hypothetical protein